MQGNFQLANATFSASKNVRTKNQQKYILLKMENMSVENVLNTSNISQISKDISKLVAKPRSLPINAHYAPKHEFQCRLKNISSTILHKPTKPVITVRKPSRELIILNHTELFVLLLLLIFNLFLPFTVKVGHQSALTLFFRILFS